MTRIGTYVSDQLSLFQVSQLHQSVDKLTQQLSSQAKSQDYTGIADSATQLLNFGNEQSSIQDFQNTNKLLTTTMQGMGASYTSLQSTMSNFQKSLTTFMSNGVTTTQSYTDLQNSAFNALKNMAFYLNSQVGGQYIFSGSKTNTPPVSFPYNTLADFQKAYDGYGVTVPATRAADLSNTTTTVLDTGTLTFNDQNGTISAQKVGQFSNIAVGSTISLSGGQENGTRLTVFANDGTNMTVSRTLVTEGSVATPSAAAMTDSTGKAMKTGPLEFSGPNTITATQSAVPTTTLAAATTGAPDQLVNLVGNAGFNLGIRNGDTFVMAVTGTGASAVTFTVGAARSTGVGNGGGTSINDLTSWIASQTTGRVGGGAAGDVTFSFAGGNATLTPGGGANQNVTASGNVAVALGLVGAAADVTPGGGPSTSTLTANTLTVAPAPTSNIQMLTGLVDNSGVSLGIKTNDTFTVTNGAATTTFTVGAARSVVNGNGGGNTLADFAAWLHAQQIGAMAGPNQLTLKIGDGANGTLAVNNAGGVLGDDVTLSGAMASDLGFSGANATAAHNTAANGLGSYRVFATVPNTSAFQSLKVGDSFTVSGAANDANNGSFYVAGKDLTGASLTISRVNLSAPASLTATTNDTNALISSGAFSYGNSGAYSTGALTFTNTNNVDTIVATTANSLQTIPVGGFITVANATNAANNGTYVVTANTGTQITLSAITQTSLTAEAANAAATINNGTPTTFTPGTLAFFAGGSTIQAGNTGTLAGLKIGQTVNVSGTASNNGSLVVTNTFPSSVTSEVETPTLTAAADGQAVISGAGSTFGATGTLVNTGNLTFTNPNTITATTGGSLANLTNGSRITITNAANPLNDGTFVVIANSGTSVQLALPTQMVVNGGTALSPADPVTFAASAATPSMTGSSADLGSLKAGDVIAVSGTASNNANFVVSGTPSAKLSSEAGTAGVIFTSGATVVNTLADTTTVNAANGVIFTAATSLGAFVAGQSVTLTNAVQATNNAAQTVTKIFNDVVAAEGPLAAGSITLTRNNSATALSTSGTFTFAAGPAPTLTAGTAADVASVAVGDIITVGGSGPSNNLKKSFVVTANAGGVLSLSPAGQAMRVADLKVPLAPPNTAVQVAKNISVSTSTYYQGNSTVQTQQVDTNRSMTFGVTAMDPAFEKAIRAMQMIAQGTLGTAGGLDLNRGRLTTATQLMFSAATQAAAPSSTELSGNILSLQNILAVQQKDLGDIGTQQTTYLDFVQGMHDQLIGVDQQSTIENLLNQQQALQASYQSMASVRQLSLLTYLK